MSWWAKVPPQRNEPGTPREPDLLWTVWTELAGRTYVPGCGLAYR
jgi:hypothetical protein